MDPAIEDLINSINFELDPTYVIRFLQNGATYFLKEMDFVITGDSLVRKRYWTDSSSEALKFYNYDEITNFIEHQLIGTPVTVTEIL